MQIEQKQSALPSFSDPLLEDNYKPVYEVPCNSLVQKQEDKISISGVYTNPIFLNPNVANALEVPTALPRVLSVIYDKADDYQDKIAGYVILTTRGELKIISLPRLADFLSRLDKPLTNAVQNSAYALGKPLDLTAPCHKIYTFFPDKHDNQEKGIRNSNGSIKILLPDSISRHWFCSLTYKDLRRLYDYYNNLIFDNKLCQAVSFHWLRDSDQPTFVEITLQQEQDALKADFLDGYKPMHISYYINRKFFKDNPQVFLEVFIHDLIHCLGIPSTHNATFNRYCELAKGKLPSLEILGTDVKNISDGKGKWARINYTKLKADTHDTLAILCPVCENVLKPGRNNTCVCLQGHSIQCK